MLQDIARHLLESGEKLVTVESCTGGLVGKLITDIEGSSCWYEGGFISYSNKAKIQMLGVSNHLIKRHGAVSLELARAMAEGALNKSEAEWSLSITGVAGPGGGTTSKPVGTVCFGWAYSIQQMSMVEQKLFKGDREAVRSQAADYALQQLFVLMGHSQ